MRTEQSVHANRAVHEGGACVTSYEGWGLPAGTQLQKFDYAGVAFEMARQIAVLDGSRPNRDYACDLIRTMGYSTSQFTRMQDLVNTLMVGTRFDMVLASFDGDQNAALSGARILRQAAQTAMPVLLMMQPDQFREADSFVMDPAVDFVMLPCEDCEMVARIAAFMKAADSAPSMQLSFGRYRFEPSACSVSFDGRCVRLRPKEFELALLLFRKAGTTLSRDEISQAVWRRGELQVSTRTVDMHIANVRRKLMLRPGGAARLSCVYGLGYVLLLEDQ